MDNKKLDPKYFLLRLIFAIAVGFLISTFNLDFIEGHLIDLRIKTKSFLGLSKLKAPSVAIVLISPKTVEKFQGEPKFKDHIRFLNQLSSFNPRFIVYELRIEDETFIDITGTDAEKKEFAEEVKSIPNLIFSTQDLKLKGQTEELKLKAPLDTLKLSSMPFSVDGKSFGKDGVTRRLMFQYQGQSMAQPILASYYNPALQNVENIRGSFFYMDSLQLYIDYHPNGSFPTYSFEDVVDQKVPKDAFENKIVIVGTDLNKGAADYAATPFNRHFSAMTKVELQANQFQTLIDNSALIRLPKPFTIALTILISLLTLYATLSLTPAKGLLVLGATFVGLAFTSIFLFVSFGLWVELAHPFLAIFLCYYFFIPYRLIRENRKSWEYYQKHKLLSEVEQLKTNFISMMSHDLKTPIARITGMTEVIYKDPVQLSPHQREALDTIRHSSDDLLKFINAILQYGSIESQGVQLHKQSKDINALVAEVVKKHQFLANVN